MKRVERLSFSIQDSVKPYYDLFKFKASKDGSIYVSYPDLFGNLGAHFSFHASGRTHFRTANPKLSTPDIHMKDLAQDIIQKKNNFFTPTSLSDMTNGFFGVLKISNFVAALSSGRMYGLDGKRVVISGQETTSLLRKTNVRFFENLQEETEKLEKQGSIEENDLIVATKGEPHSMLMASYKKGKYDGIRFNNSISSLNQLPGFAVLYKPLFDLKKNNVRINPSLPSFY